MDVHCAAKQKRKQCLAGENGAVDFFGQLESGWFHGCNRVSVWVCVMVDYGMQVIR